MENRIGPCPIPRCALEWGLAGMSVLVGIALLFLPLGLQMQEWLGQTSIEVCHLIQPAWGTILIGAGVIQMVTLIVPRLPQHVAAIFAAFAWFTVGFLAFQAGLLLFAVVTLVMVLGEIYVGLMLKP